MPRIQTAPAHRGRRHLLLPDALTGSTETSRGRDLTRHKGQGNGWRVHAIYFVAVSLVALVLIIVAIAIAT